MLIDFTIKNYLSIRDKVTLSLLASNNSDNDFDEIKLNSIENNKYKLLTFAGIYGPNASGKSNLIKGFSDFINLVLFSHQLNVDQRIPSYKPFKLDFINLSEPVCFEIEFVLNEIRYLYIIEFTEIEILKEELYFWPELKKAKLYVRQKGKLIDYGKTYFKGERKSIEKNLLPNTLFLSKAANSSHDLLLPIYRYFRDNYNIHVQMDSSSAPILETTYKLEENEEKYKDLVMGILNAGDLNIKDIKIVRDKSVSKKLLTAIDARDDKVPELMKKRLIDSFAYNVHIGHSLYSKDKETEEIVYLDLDDEESSGTIKMYDMAVEIIDSLKNGNVLFIDEFNSGLHPHLNQYIVNLFLDSNINRKGAQLIISTHDTCVLEIDTIRRDQIWFTDKDCRGASELFSLDEFDKNRVRANTNFAKWYLNGRFKAIPALDNNKFNIWD